MRNINAGDVGLQLCRGSNCHSQLLMRRIFRMKGWVTRNGAAPRAAPAMTRSQVRARFPIWQKYAKAGKQGHFS